MESVIIWRSRWNSLGKMTTESLSIGLSATQTQLESQGIIVCITPQLFAVWRRSREGRHDVGFVEAHYASPLLQNFNAGDSMCVKAIHLYHPHPERPAPPHQHHPIGFIARISRPCGRCAGRSTSLLLLAPWSAMMTRHVVGGSAVCSDLAGLRQNLGTTT